MKRFLHQTSILRLTLTTKLAALALAALFGVSAALAAADHAGKTALKIYVAEHGVGVGSGTFTLQGASADPVAAHYLHYQPEAGTPWQVLEAETAQQTAGDPAKSYRAGESTGDVRFVFGIRTWF